jgi:type VI secretion system protein ImpJ
MSDVRKPIFWYQGLFLQPQHFQQAERYHHSLLEPLRGSVAPYFRGVGRLQVPEAAVANRTLEITRGEFLFPDGTWAVVPGNAILPAASFIKADFDTTRPFKVYAGLRKWDPAGANTTVIQKPDEALEASTRFICVAAPEEVPDLHQPAQPAQIRWLQYNLRLFWESELPNLGDYHLLPVAQIAFDGREHKLSREFIPPTVSLDGSDILGGILRNIQEQMISRSRLLEEYKNPRGIQNAELETNYIYFLLALRSINRYVPMLEHFMATPSVHPWTAYGLLRQVVGELSGFTDRVNALGQLADGTQLLPEYDHDNLWFCFDQAQILIGELLSAIVIGPESIIDLLRDGSAFKGKIPLNLFDSRNVFYLNIQTSGNPDQVTGSLTRLAKISSAERAPALVTRALPGLPLEYHEVPPPGLPKRPNSFCFRLDRSSPHWLDIQQGQNLCLYWDAAPADTKAELIVLRR